MGGGSRPPPPKIPGSGSKGCGNWEYSLPKKEGKTGKNEGWAEKEEKREKAAFPTPGKRGIFWGDSSEKFPVFPQEIGILAAEMEDLGWERGKMGSEPLPPPPDPLENSKVFEGIGDSGFFWFFTPKSPEFVLKKKAEILGFHHKVGNF